MIVKKLTLSIIIPAYNEEHQLAACLKSLAAQLDAPHEVIVVDNNSTDGTAELARSFPFAKVINEPMQGLIPARNRGFAEARGDILARIDADARLAPDWTRRVKMQFEENPDLAGLTGPALAATLFYVNRWHTTFWTMVYFWTSDAFFRVRILWGANMTVRRSAWEIIKGSTCPDDNQVHEDQDLSNLLAGQGLTVMRDKQMQIETNGHAYHDWPKFKEYMWRRWRTKLYHHRRGTLRTPAALTIPRYKTIPILIIMFLPALLFASTSLLSHYPRLLLKKLKS